MSSASTALRRQERAEPALEPEPELYAARGSKKSEPVSAAKNGNDAPTAEQSGPAADGGNYDAGNHDAGDIDMAAAGAETPADAVVKTPAKDGDRTTAASAEIAEAEEAAEAEATENETNETEKRKYTTGEEAADHE